MDKIVTVANHHEVLTAWENCRVNCGAPLQVLSLDFHTDTLDCRRRGIGLPENAASAVKLLHHDEHFDWALQTGIISQAVIVAVSPCAEPPAHPGLTVKNPEQLPDLQTLLNDPESFRELAQSFLQDEFLKPLIPDDFPQDPYILDIDCDFILCEKALDIAPDSRLCRLAANAKLITLSTEDEWVKILKLPGEKITGQSIAGKLRDTFLNINIL